MATGDCLYQVCCCGALLYECLNERGERIGVTHATVEEDDHHFKYLCGFTVSLPEQDDDEEPS